MSLAEIMATPHDAPPALPVPTEPKGPIKSWRKKFRKMKLRFDRSIDESNVLYREEQNAMVLAKRLQEQNDQLLELLLDVNDTTHIPVGLRFTLRSPSPSASAVPSLESDQPRSLQILQNSTPHTRPSPASIDTIPELIHSDPLGFFSPTHEEDYLTTLDAILAPPIPGEPIPLHTYDVHDPSNNDGRPFKAMERAGTLITDKEVSLKNPMSVTNWLRRNQPEVFLQDKYEERTNAKASRAAAAAAAGGDGVPECGHGVRSKRASLASVSTPIAVPKTEEDLLVDEDAGFFHENGKGSLRGVKRTRDDEPYRPKGGSSRPKRKRTSVAGEEGSRKKSRPSNVPADEGGEE